MTGYIVIDYSLCVFIMSLFFIHIPEYTRVYQSIPEYTWVYQSIPEYTRVYLGIPTMYTFVYLCISICTCIIYLCIPGYTNVLYLHWTANTCVQAGIYFFHSVSITINDKVFVHKMNKNYSLCHFNKI